MKAKINYGTFEIQTPTLTVADQRVLSKYLGMPRRSMISYIVTRITDSRREFDFVPKESTFVASLRYPREDYTVYFHYQPPSPQEVESMVDDGSPLCGTLVPDGMRYDYS